MNTAVTLTIDPKKANPLMDTLGRISSIPWAIIWDALQTVWIKNDLTKWFVEKWGNRKHLPATSVKLWVKEIKSKMEQKKLMKDMWKLIKQNWIDPTGLSIEQMELLISNFK